MRDVPPVTSDDPAATSAPPTVSYAAWGEEFFRAAVSADRVVGGINVLAGQPVEVGPMGVGPGRVVKVTARGSIGEATGERVAHEPATFRVRLPVSLRFTLDLGVDRHRFDAELTVPLLVVAHARADLAIDLDVQPPHAHQVGCRLEARGLRASVTKHAANVEGELRRFVARYVAREVTKPYVMAARTIDVSRAIDQAMAALVPRRPAAQSLADLPAALAEEIQEVGDDLGGDLVTGGTPPAPAPPALP
ncbi:hypothetical protein GCM10023226_39250 [Nocardioides nanhaiensis]|uniref:Uncharacterized protein n=1 Tax=Nocardioides nanhaiensis TaxID=1476871 RepID=A0ABP8WYT9_9ACTN